MADRRPKCHRCKQPESMPGLHYVEWDDAVGYHSESLCDQCYDRWADEVGERIDD